MLNIVITNHWYFEEELLDCLTTMLNIVIANLRMSAKLNQTINKSSN